MVSGTIFDGRPHAVGPDARGVLELDLALRRAERRAELRRRRRPDAAAHRGAVAGRAGRASVAIPTPACPTASAASTGDREHMAGTLGEFAANGWLNIVGGCCGTTPEHIARHRRGRRGRRPARGRPTCRAGPTTAASSRWSSAPRPTSSWSASGRNVTGSQKFARLIKEEQVRRSRRRRPRAGRGRREHHRRQHGRGPARRRSGDDEVPEPDRRRARHRRVPVMVDSSKWSVIEAGLKCVQGKSIVNSISLKEGEEKFLEQARLVRRYGAAVVVMAFDEQGQAVDGRRQGRASASGRIKLLTEKVGFAAAGHHLRPNILTVGTGIEEHNNYAVDFIEAVAASQAASAPGRRPPAASATSRSRSAATTSVREAMHAAFLYHAIQAGLDMGIVNAGQLAGLRRDPQGPARARRRRAAQPPARRHRAAGRVRRDGQEEGQEGRRQANWPGATAPVEERLKHALVKGIVEYIDADVEEARQKYDRPLHDHRRPADGRHERRRRPVRRGQDVPAAGGQERPRDEEGGRLSAAVHGSREGRKAGTAQQAARQDPAWPPSKATSTTSARTSSASCSAATTTKSSTWA